MLEHNDVEVTVITVEDDLLGEAVKSVFIPKNPKISDDKEIPDFLGKHS